MSTIFAIMSGNASRGISSCGLCQRTDAGHLENKGRATRTNEAFVKSRCRTRKGLSTMRGRPQGCVRMGCAHDGMGKETASRPPENNPLAAPSRPARHDTRRRKGEAKHDTAKDSGG